jgi:lipoteichoic acid synthase
MSSTESRSRVWIVDFGPLVCVLVSLWLKQVYFSASLRNLWALPEESFGSWLRAHPHAISAELASLLLLFCLTPLIPRVWRYGALWVANFFLTALIVVDLLYAHYYGDVLSFVNVANVPMLPLIKETITYQLRPIHAVFFLDVLVGILLFPTYRRLTQGQSNLRPRHAWRFAFCLGILGVLFALPSVNLLRRDRSALFAYSTLRRHVCSVTGLLPYHLADLGIHLAQSGHGVDARDVGRARAFVDERRATRSASSLFGIARGRNLIVVMAESLQQFPIGLKIRDQAVTPRLDEFAGESLHFVNFYDQTYLGTTSDGEFASFQSLHPLPVGAVAMSHRQNRFGGLPAVLAEHGYATSSATAESGWFWYMKAMHKSLGFQTSYFEENFVRDEKIGEWLADREFFIQTLPILQAQSRPFMAYLLTSSNHDPWILPEKYRELDLGDLEGTTLGNYLHSVHYFDGAFGEFVDRLRESGLLDDSVLVVFGDHQAGLGSTPEFSRLLGLAEGEDCRRLSASKKVAMMIRLPHGEAAGERQVTGGHLDISPTLMSLLGIYDGDSVMFGNDLTTGNDSLVAFRDGSFVDGKHLFLNRFGPISDCTCYEIASGDSVDCLPREGARRRVREALEVSDTIIRGDLIPSLTAERVSAEGSVPAGDVGK